MSKKQQLIFIPPPNKKMIVYENINADKKLRKTMTDHFFDLIPELIDNDKRFKKLKSKKYKEFFNTRESYKLIYNILRYYAKKYDINWYDLRSKSHNDDTLNYLAFKLTNKL